MRALRVLGLAEDGEHLVCEEESSGEQFTVPADDRLRAAARGDVSRFGQLEIEMESQLRPRDIQARIRAGASVDEVATAAGTSASKIERYAYPVLLERSTVADRGRQAHPMLGGSPASRTVSDLVTKTLAERGQDSGVTWDAFKEDRNWILSVMWRAGRSENRAHWVFHPGPSGGTVTARDEAAADLIDPAPKPLRTIRSQAPALDGALEASTAAHPAGRALQQPAADPLVGLATPRSAAAPAVPATPVAPVAPVVSGHKSGAQKPTSHKPTVQQPAAALPTATVHADDVKAQQERLVADTVTDARSAVHPAVPASRPAARTGTDHASGSPRRGQRPAMPSWEDVLLGTRSKES